MKLYRFSPIESEEQLIGAFYLNFSSRAPLIHASPEEAVNIAKEIKTKKIIGMHWGSIKLASENPKELFPRIQKHAQEIEYNGEVMILRIGETISI